MYEFLRHYHPGADLGVGEAPQLKSVNQPNHSFIMATLRILNSTKSNKLDTYWSLCATIIKQKIGKADVELVGEERYFLSSVTPLPVGETIDTKDFPSLQRAD